MSKEVKKPPVVEFMIPKKIFSRADPTADEKDNLLTSLWDFSS
jgi:U3 small nucleolar RNA-associated protein 19